MRLGQLVLLVDDEAAVLEIIGQALEALGYRVLTATDGAEGLKLFQEHSEEIHLVLADMNMPVMDGSFMIREIYRLKPSVGIIAASGSGYDKKNSPLSVIHLAKPYTIQELSEALKQAGKP